MKKKSSAFVLSGILLLSCSLTGCVNASLEASESLAASTLYQPPVLRLTKGQEVQTKDGQYRPQTDEIWHSDARFRSVEQQLIDAIVALNAKKP